MLVAAANPWGELALALVPVLVLLRLELLDRRARWQRAELLRVQGVRRTSRRDGGRRKTDRT
jgi:uncharacterized membrane protein affecting hemolysin expression